MLTTLIVQPIFNLLVLIYALVPGHNFGLAIIIFTLIVRLLMWPLVKKQLRQARAMRELAPELKKIKASAKGDRQLESRLTMELYREKEVNPFASLGILLVQLPILIGLYVGIRRLVTNPEEIITFSYPVLHHLSWLKQISGNIHLFDNSLFGIVNLTRAAVSPSGVYWSAMVIVVASSVAQYFQTRQLMPQDPDARSLKSILKQAGGGKQADPSEVNAAVGRNMQYLIPFIVFIVYIRLAVALPLYWLSSSVIAYAQQARILKKDALVADKSVEVSPSASSQAKTKKPAHRRRRK